MSNPCKLTVSKVITAIRYHEFELKWGSWVKMSLLHWHILRKISGTWPTRVESKVQCCYSQCDLWSNWPLEQWKIAIFPRNFGNFSAKYGKFIENPRITCQKADVSADLEPKKRPCSYCHIDCWIPVHKTCKKNSKNGFFKGWSWFLALLLFQATMTS